MPELTADLVLRKIKSGEKVERADLRGLVMPKALLEGVSFRRCDLDGANFEGARLARAVLKNASLREAFLATADLREANLESADLEGANLQGANLVGANLSRANLEGANLQGADLSGARLTHAQLESAKLGGAKLIGAQLAHADLGETDLSTAKLDDADLTNANLCGANLEEASLARAQLRDAQLRGANAKGARFTEAVLVNAALATADLTNADLTGADVRRVNLAGARLDGATVTGARVHGVLGTGAPIQGLRAEWVDDSVDGSGTKRVNAADAAALLSGQAAVQKRYFGRGDVLRNAHLEFDAGASVEIESLFEQCTIALGDDAELVIGKAGVLAGCQIRGAGKITVHGKFVERDSPGIQGPTQLVVSSCGSLTGAVEQSADLTRFAFEPGCMLRMKIQQGKKERAAEKAAKGGRQR
jgi:uncharacterized protein YjbI with pentapeptide repeats